MPEVRPAAIEAAKEKADASSSSHGGVVDKEGNPFDVATHENDNGVPRLNLDGTAKRKRGHGAKGAIGAKAANQSRVTPTGGQKPVDVAAQSAAEMQAAAALAAQLTFSLGQLVGGPEFKPEEGEPEAMHAAYYAVCQKYGISDLPPLAVLAVVVGGYTVKRWHKPVFKEKRVGWRQKVKQWWFRKKLAKETQVATQRESSKTPPNTPSPPVSPPAVSPDNSEEVGGAWDKT